MAEPVALYLLTLSVYAQHLSLTIKKDETVHLDDPV